MPVSFIGLASAAIQGLLEEDTSFALLKVVNRNAVLTGTLP